jgi:hypothetical protein
MLEEFRREYAGFNTDLNRESYLFQSGQKPELELGPIYERYTDLYTIDAITALRGALDDTPEHFEGERTSLRRLLSFSVEQFMASSVRHLTEQISQTESGATIEWAARPLTFHDASVAIVSEHNRDVRKELYRRRSDVIERSNDIRLERLRGIHDSARRVRSLFAPPVWLQPVSTVHRGKRQSRRVGVHQLFGLWRAIPGAVST